MCCTYETPMLDQYLPPVMFTEFVLGLWGTFSPFNVLLPQGHLEAQFYLSCPSSLWPTHWSFSAFLSGPTTTAGARTGSTETLSAVFYSFFWPPTEPAVYSSSLLSPWTDTWRSFTLSTASTEWVCVMPCGSLLACGFLIIAMTVYLLTDEHFYYLNNHTQCRELQHLLWNNSRFNWHNVFYVLQFFVPTAIVIYCTTCITWQLKSKTVDTQGKIKRAVCSSS